MVICGFNHNSSVKKTLNLKIFNPRGGEKNTKNAKREDVFGFGGKSFGPSSVGGWCMLLHACTILFEVQNYSISMCSHRVRIFYCFVCLLIAFHLAF